MFEEVRETAPPGRVILGADPIPDLNRDGRRGVIFEPDELETVGELALLEVQARDRFRSAERQRRS